MSEFAYNFRTHYRFDRKEMLDLVAAILVVAFIFAFDDKSEVFSWSHWVFNYFNNILIVLVAFLVHVSAQKVGALYFGYRATFRMWSYGLGIGFALSLLSKGQLILPLPGGIHFEPIERHRVGKYRYGINNNTAGWVAAMGPIANIVAGMFMTFLFVQVLGMENTGLLAQFIRVNFLLAFFMMLPLPPLPGLQLFYGDRMAYALVLGFMIGYVGLFVTGFLSLFAAVFIAIVVWALYYFIIERYIQ